MVWSKDVTQIICANALATNHLHILSNASERYPSSFAGKVLCAQGVFRWKRNALEPFLVINAFW